MSDELYPNSRSGVRMPRILYGTAWKKERTAQLVLQALRLGFRGVDTACQPKHYHEPGVGDAVAAFIREGGKRSELYLQTKFTPIGGQDPQRVPYDSRASLQQQIEQSFAVSLRNLQTDYLDGLVLHSPLSRREQTLEAWHAMESLVDGGGVRQLGISNCYDLRDLKALHQSARVKPAVLQNRFYADTGYDVDIRSFCRQEGIVYESFWTLTANPGLLGNPKLLNLASQHQCAPAQILFRYLSQQGVVPLTGTTSEVHMRDDLAIFDFELSESECETLDRLL
jgi:diketogulonate reductase-like aldo/keto reductase